MRLWRQRRLLPNRDPSVLRRQDLLPGGPTVLRYGTGMLSAGQMHRRREMLCRHHGALWERLLPGGIHLLWGQPRLPSARASVLTRSMQRESV